MKSLSQIIRAEIAATGALTFARFMELALYCPDYGYYEQQKDTVGRRGDFITSVSTGSLFGQLLAFQFAGWLEEIKRQRPQVSTLTLLEAGAHDGRLAGDILHWFQLNRPQLFAQLQFVLLEPSPRQQAWQRETLKPFAPRVRWAADFQAVSASTQAGSFNGIIFSNELLDAFPCHRFSWDAGQQAWFEWGVAMDAEKFVWEKISRLSSELPVIPGQLPAALMAVLPDGYTIEVSPAAEKWWREAAGILSCGKLLAIDYGFKGAEQISPARPHGTMRAYFRHHFSDDLLANPGQQDLTAHVNFPAIQQAGEEAGLATESFQTQPQFLTCILAKAVRDKFFGEWNASRTRQFQTLTHPEHLGRAFRVLVQSR